MMLCWGAETIVGGCCEFSYWLLYGWCHAQSGVETSYLVYGFLTKGIGFRIVVELVSPWEEGEP